MTNNERIAHLIQQLQEETEQFFWDKVQPYLDNNDLNSRDLMIIVTLLLGKVIWLRTIVEDDDCDVLAIERKMDALIKESNKLLPECMNNIHKRSEH